MELCSNTEWLCKEPQQAMLHRRVLQYARFGCFHGIPLYSHRLRRLVQKSSVEVVVVGRRTVLQLGEEIAMSEELLDRSDWVIVNIAAGKEKRIGAATATREWCVEIDNRENEHYVFVIGGKADGDDQEILVAGGERLRACLSGEELLLRNDESVSVTTKYAYPWPQ
jgi:hypothetical protein